MSVTPAMPFFNLPSRQKDHQNHESLRLIPTNGIRSRSSTRSLIDPVSSTSNENVIALSFCYLFSLVSFISTTSDQDISASAFGRLLQRPYPPLAIRIFFFSSSASDFLLQVPYPTLAKRILSVSGKLREQGPEVWIRSSCRTPTVQSSIKISQDYGGCSKFNVAMEQFNRTSAPYQWAGRKNNSIPASLEEQVGNKEVQREARPISEKGVAPFTPVRDLIAPPHSLNTVFTPIITMNLRNLLRELSLCI